MQFETDLLKRCWFLAGPTACGKSSTGLIIAKRINAEIVSLDSMAIFQGMDIGTAKPSLDEQQIVPHHLIDIASPAEDFSVADYLLAASDACQQIVARQRTPLFVGGTGLYLRSILRGVFNGPAADWDLRQQLETEIETHGKDIVWQKLNDMDPAAAAKVHANDIRRVIRAIEVIKTTGKLISEQQQQQPLPIEDRPANVFWLNPDRDWLYDRINQRVLTMIDNGLVAEVARILACDPPIGRTARQGLGYKEIIQHIESELPLPEAIEMVQTRTRQFAKRQHTWFRNLEECKPIDVGSPDNAEEIADKLMQMATAT